MILINGIMFWRCSHVAEASKDTIMQVEVYMS